jgi:hypothetical protein
MISRLTRTILYKPSTKTVDLILEQEGQDTAEAQQHQAVQVELKPALKTSQCFTALRFNESAPS